MKILIRLPNWLGDMVMSVAFINQLQLVFPGAEISVIVKDGLQSLLKFFPETKHRFIFSRNEFKGLKGVYQFGKKIAAKEKFDLFFCLPDSFSAAFMGFATGAVKRIGYKNELRSFFLTNAYTKRKKIHRVEMFTDLLKVYAGIKPLPALVKLRAERTANQQVIVNVNSEASSRRLPAEKAIGLINYLRSQIENDIVLTGSPAEQNFVENIFMSLHDKKGIKNIAGKTSLHELVNTISNSKLVLSTDSGIAHVSNALGVHTIVLFGAGHENETAPFNAENRTIIRLGELSCEPCGNNVCKRFGIPKCLTLLDNSKLIEEVLKHN